MPLKSRKGFSWAWVLLFGFSFFFILYVLFPWHSLYQEMEKDQGASPLAIAYLNNLIQKQPHHLEYRVRLAEQEIKQGNLQRAAEIIAPYLPEATNKPCSVKFHYLDYQIIRINTYQQKSGSAKRLKLEQKLLKKIQELQNISSLSSQEIAQLGQDALAMNEPKLAIGFYEKLLNKPFDLDRSVYEEAAKAALFVSDYQKSAEFYWILFKKSTSFEEKRLAFFGAIDSMKASGDVKKALSVANAHLDGLVHDPHILRFMIELSLNANQPQMAKKYVEALPLGVFNQEQYELAYRVYLLNADTQKAYILAKRAVQETKDLGIQKKWRTRLARVSLWEQDPVQASEEYLFLAEHFSDSTALEKGIQLANNLQNDAMLLRLLHLALHKDPHNEAFAFLALDAYLRLGKIKQAKVFVAKYQHDFSPAFSLVAQAKIYHLTGNLHKELQMLMDYSHLFGMTPTIALQQAVIYSAWRQMQKASNVLMAAKKKALASKEKMVDFWLSYANIASLVNQPQEERFAYVQLLHQKEVAERVYMQLVHLYRPSNPRLAYVYAKQGKQAYPKNITLAVDAFSLCLQNAAWDDFPWLDSTTPNSIRNKLYYDSAYGEVKVNYLLLQGRFEDAVQEYLSVLRFLSTNHYIHADFLYFLIRNYDVQRLAMVLSSWEESNIFTEPMWGAYAEAYSRLNNPALSLFTLQLFYQHFNDYQRDPFWLLAFHDVLMSTYHVQEAWGIMHVAWPLYLSILQEQKTEPDHTQLLNYAKFAAQEAPGDVMLSILARLQKIPHPETEWLSLDWAFDIHDYALALAIYHHARAYRFLLPTWAVLSIAIQQNDRYFMREVLLGSNPRISSNPRKVEAYRDEIQAAENIDALPWAQSKAYHALEEHPLDTTLYDDMFTPLMLKTARIGLVSQEFYQYSNVEGPRNRLGFQFFPMPSLSILPHQSLWFSHETEQQPSFLNKNVAVSTQTITNVPKYDEQSGITFVMKQDRGDVLFDLGFRSDLNQFATARLARSYQLAHDMNATLDLGLHQEANDSLGLLVGGMKNDIHISANYRWTPDDSILADIFENMLYTQSGQHVANGLQGMMSLEHRLRSTYPDWTLALYGTGTLYTHKTDHLSGSILRLIPQGIAPNVDFLIPNSFVEYGVTASFGQFLIDQYTHALRPFASFTLSNNTNVGIGALFNIGLSSAILGRDKLLIYYNQGTNQGTGIQIQRLAKVTYSLYF